MIYPKPRVGFCLLAHPFEDGYKDAIPLIQKANQFLSRTKIEIFSFEKPVTNISVAREAIHLFKQQNLDVLIIKLATWSDDYNALALVQALNLPVITWAIEGISRGSLCGCQQINSILYELGYHYDFVLGDAQDPETIDLIEQKVKAYGLIQYLKQVRIGILGNRTAGMTEIAYDEFEMRRLFGVEIVPLSIHRFITQLDFKDQQALDSEWQRITNRVGPIKVKKEDGLRSLAALAKIRLIMKEQQLTGLAVECYPDFMGLFCLSASLLADEGKIIGCEADVNAVLGQIILSYLSETPTHNTDLLHIYPDEQAVLLSHCGNGSFQIAKNCSEIELQSVRLADQGLCVLFPAKPGPMTLINLLGRRTTYRMCILEGDCIETSMEFAGNPLKFRLPISTDDFLELVKQNGFGHHWIGGYGKFHRELELLCKVAGITHKVYY